MPDQLGHIIGCPVVSGNFFDSIAPFAPVLSSFSALVSLFLAYKVFKYTRQKNENDVKIKWFQELVYTPNKDLIFDYFKNLNLLQEKIKAAGGPLSEAQKIDLMEYTKAQSYILINSFVDMIRIIAPHLHQPINKAIEELTDQLINAFDNDELKLENPKTYQREIGTPIAQAKNQVIRCLFNYGG